MGRLVVQVLAGRKSGTTGKLAPEFPVRIEGRVVVDGFVAYRANSKAPEGDES